MLGPDRCGLEHGGKTDVSTIEKKLTSKVLLLPISLELELGSYIISIAKVTSTKLLPWFLLLNFYFCNYM